MDERWVCLRCFSSNEGAAPVCSTCGLLRGATPAAGDVQVAAASSPPRTNPILRLALRFWWLIAIAVVAVGGYVVSAQRGEGGEITRSGTLAISELRIGDCFDLSDDQAEEVQDVTARRCDEAHEYQLFHAGAMASGAYPGEEAVMTWLGNECLPAFDAFVGLAYETSTLDLAWFVPTPNGWEEGDHTLQCAVYDPDNPELTDSMRGVSR